MYKVSQDPTEITQMLNYVCGNLAHGYIRRYLEIGSYAGESLLYVAEHMKKGSLVVLVDLGDNAEAREQLLRVCKEVAQMGAEVHLLTGYAEDPEIVQKVNELRNGGQWDLVLIDGCHDYDNVVKNFEDYGYKANHTAFHDIDPRTRQGNIAKHGYDKPCAAHVWPVLKLARHTEEFINPLNDKPKGLGVLTI